MNDEFVKICPSCKEEVFYKSLQTLKSSVKSNKICRKCSSKEIHNRPGMREKNSLRQKGKFSGSENPMFGKKHSPEIIQKIKENGKVFKGENNPMFGKNFYKMWDEKFGLEISSEKRKILLEKRSFDSTGSKNHMYGKPSPQGSGNGWSGWYKNWYFRSLLELSYMINIIERFKIEWISGEKIKIPYTDIKGSERNYFPDFLLEGKYLIELKPKKLINSISVKSKSLAAIEFCNSKNWIFKIKEPRKLSFPEIIKLRDENKIEFIERYEIKYQQWKTKNR